MSDQNSAEAAPARRSFLEKCLLHPTLPVALVGVATTVVAALAPPLQDIMTARTNEVPVAVAPSSRNIAAFFSREDNLSCPSTEFEPMRFPDNTEMSVILCSTGDVVMVVKRPRLNGEPVVGIYPVLFDEVVATVDKLTDSSPPPQRNAALGALLAAYAEPSRADPPMQLAAADVVRTWREGTRTLVRLLRTGNTCYEERIDTVTGRILSRTEVKC